MRYVRMIFVACTAVLAFAACTPSESNEEPLGNDAALASVSPEASSSPSPIPTPEPTATASAAASDDVRNINATRESALGVELMTVITTVKCVGEPVSGVYVEDDDGSNEAPYGDIALGNNSQNTAVVITHNIAAQPGKYRINIGCGYATGGNNDWKHEFNLPAISGSQPNTVVCRHGEGCRLNGKAIGLR